MRSFHLSIRVAGRAQMAFQAGCCWAHRAMPSHRRLHPSCDYRKSRIDLSRSFRGFPTVHHALAVDVRHERPIIRDLAFQQSHGFFG